MQFCVAALHGCARPDVATPDIGGIVIRRLVDVGWRLVALFAALI
jgi:hypothetical protein